MEWRWTATIVFTWRRSPAFRFSIRLAVILEPYPYLGNHRTSRSPAPTRRRCSSLLEKDFTSYACSHRDRIGLASDRLRLQTRLSAGAISALWNREGPSSGRLQPEDWRAISVRRSAFGCTA